MTIALCRTLELWLAGLKFTTANRDGALYVNDVAAELRYKVTELAGSYGLHASIRGREWKLVMRADDLYYIEVEIVRVLFPSFRIGNDLPELVIPFGWDEVAVGFTPVELGDRWTTLRIEGAQLPFQIRDMSSVRPVVRYSYLIGWPIPQLIAAIESPDGGVVGSRVAASAVSFRTRSSCAALDRDRRGSSGSISAPSWPA